MKRWNAQWLLVLLAVPLMAPDPIRAEPAERPYSAAWEQLKKLSGMWKSRNLTRENSREQIVSYHVTGGEKVVFEEFVGATPGGVRNMATAYHLDGNDLVATHYCGAGNQPRMRATSWDPAARVVRFDFWDVTNVVDPDEYYTTTIELYFKDNDTVELRFRGTTAGKAEDWQVHQMKRLTGRPWQREETPFR